ncbi:MAG: transposase [Tenacibaculum sp.]
MSLHLKESSANNKRNGKGKKTLKTNIGEIDIITPTDRNSSFKPSNETMIKESFKTLN